MMNQEETVKVQEPSATISSNGSESGSLEANISNNSFLGRLRRVGNSVLPVIERIGEFVVSVLGLDDSKFQYVIDTMEEEDWKKAHEVNDKRQKESISTQEIDIELAHENLKMESSETANEL